MKMAGLGAFFGLLLGAVLAAAWYETVRIRPLEAHLAERDRLLREREQLVREEWERVRTLKAVSQEELRKGVLKAAAQQDRYVELMNLLHQQELELQSPGYTYVALALIAVLGAMALMTWWLRGSNAATATAVELAVGQLPGDLAGSLLRVPRRAAGGGAVEGRARESLPPAEGPRALPSEE
jgi:hypothetical protein